MTSDADFFKELMTMFKMESREHLQSISDGLVSLGKELPDDQRKEIMETVFRAAHSLKGAARTVGVVDIETVGQSLEHLFSVVKQKEMVPPSPMMALIRDVLMQLGGLVDSVDEQGKVNADKTEVMRLMEDVNEQITQLKS